MRKPGRHESRAAAIALALVVLALAYLVLVHWWFTAPLLELSRQAQPLRDQRQRYTNIISQRDTLTKRLHALQAAPANDRGFLAGSDNHAATASLMQRVVAVVANHLGAGPCKVTQKMPIPTPDGKGPYRKVSANINMLCNMHSLAAIIHDLEYGQPALFVDSFAAYHTRMQGRDGTTSPLTVQLKVSGYMHAASGSEP